MKARSPASRAWIVLILLGLVLAAPVGIEQVSASSNGPNVAVVGDSITARYNNNAGSAKQGWWSIVGKHYGAKVTRYAQSGSGFQRPGHACTGTIFSERLSALKKQKPDVVFVEGGRNDWAYCKHHKLKQASNARIKKGVDSFLARLKKSVPAGTTIYVLGPPWGPKDLDQRERVTAIVKASAKAHHMIYISTRGSFSKKRVVDGIHPNRAGSVKLGKKVIKAVGSKLG